MAVHANSTLAPKIDRADVMRTAWTECRRARTFNGKFIFSREAFSIALKKAWQHVKAAAGRLSGVELVRLERVAAIKADIEALTYKSLRYDVGAIRQRLEAELAAAAA